MSYLTRDLLLKANNAMFPPPLFYPSIRLNFAENLLAGRNATDTAIYVCEEGGVNLRETSWGAIYSGVERIADALRSAGVTTGDRIGAVISNSAETLTLCLATLSIGALWSTMSPDMGVSGILDRLSQIRPKLVFAESSVLYNGKKRELMPGNRDWIAALSKTPDFQTAVIIPRSDDSVPSDRATKLIPWKEFLQSGRGRKLQFAQLPFNHPSFIVYSSGTVSCSCIERW
jgi:acetoacetyl-CoA synthetase